MSRIYSFIADIYIAPLQVGLLRSAQLPRGRIMLFQIAEGISGRILLSGGMFISISTVISIIYTR